MADESLSTARSNSQEEGKMGALTDFLGAGEVATALGGVVTALLDKLEHAVGWCANHDTPSRTAVNTYMITVCIFCNSKKFFQIFFCRLQLYHRDHRLRGSPKKLSTAFCTSGSHTCNKCSMSVCIHTRYYLKRILRSKCCIDHFFRIFRSIIKPLWCSSRLNRLIPDSHNPCRPVQIAKHTILIIYPGI